MVWRNVAEVARLPTFGCRVWVSELLRVPLRGDCDTWNGEPRPKLGAGGGGGTGGGVETTIGRTDVVPWTEVAESRSIAR